MTEFIASWHLREFRQHVCSCRSSLVYIQPILLLYGSETWSMAQSLQNRLDHQTSSNTAVLDGYSVYSSVTGVPMPRLDNRLEAIHLRLTSSPTAQPSTNYARNLRSHIWGPPMDWSRPPGRPRRTWLRTIESDLQPLNIGLFSVWRRTQDRTLCVEAYCGEGYAAARGFPLMMMMMFKTRKQKCSLVSLLGPGCRLLPQY